jgi:hypothetical protein
MVGRTHTGDSVAVVFHREGQPDETRIATDGNDAVYVAMRLIAEHEELLPGDRLTIEIGEDVPATSRASHYS